MKPDAGEYALEMHACTTSQQRGRCFGGYTLTQCFSTRLNASNFLTRSSSSEKQSFA